MGHYKQQEVDFISRTKEILRQYDKYVNPPETRYNVTLFINCMMGLLIIPQQYWYGNLPTVDVSEAHWGIGPDMISCANNGKGIDEVARHLRNSLAHNNFFSLPGDKDYLNTFQFKDYSNKTPTFDATIPVDGLRKFVGKLADAFLEAMETEK